MTPEEIIAAELERNWAPLANLPTIAEDQAADLLAALREAGYRIVRQREWTAFDLMTLQPWADVEDGAR